MRYSEFSQGLIKLSAEQKKSKLRRAAEGLLAGGIGYGAGYGAGRYLAPAITGRPPNISPRMAKVLGLISGLSMAGMYAMQGRHVYDNNSRTGNSRKNRANSAVQSGNRKLIVRRKRHPSEVSSGVLLPNAKREESFSFRSGRGMGDRRVNVGADNYRQRSDKYGYTRKKTRDYSFEEPVQLRKPRDG